MEKEHWETSTIELGSPNYAKIGAKIMDLEGNEVDVLGATGKVPGYKYFGATKFLPMPKYLLNKTPRGEE
jgi:hypothetical protein